MQVVVFMLLETREGQNDMRSDDFTQVPVEPGGEGRCIVHVLVVVLKLHVDRCDFSFHGGRVSWELAIFASGGLEICGVARWEQGGQCMVSLRGL